MLKNRRKNFEIFLKICHMRKNHEGNSMGHSKRHIYQKPLLLLFYLKNARIALNVLN